MREILYVIMAPMDRILVIQDSSLINSMLRSRLEPAGFFIETVESAEAGLQKLKESSYQLIILDIKLPGMSGDQACRFIKGQEVTRHIPVLFLSGQDESKLSVLTAQAGAQGYVLLPFEGAALVQKIKDTLKKI